MFTKQILTWVIKKKTHVSWQAKNYNSTTHIGSFCILYLDLKMCGSKTIMNFETVKLDK